MIPPNVTASGNSHAMAVNGHGIQRSPSSSSSEGNSNSNNSNNNNNGAALITATGLAAAASTTKKRHRGRSLRSNVLLRPRRLSIPLPLPLPLPPQPQPQLDDSESEEEFSSSDYSSDKEDTDDDGKADGAVVVVEPALVEYRVLRPVVEVGDPGDTLFWGWVVLLSTWVVFVVGIGSVLGVWEWAWTGEVGSGGRKWPKSIGGEKDFLGEFPIPGYYPAMGILSCVMAWVWVVVSWVGLKYFKHAKIQS